MFRGLVLLLALGYGAAAQDAEQRRLNELLTPSVVAVRNQEGYGTGIVLDDKGLILTNAHVIISPTPLRVEVDGAIGAFQRVTLMGVHPKRDLALLKIDPAERKAKLVPIKIAKSRALAGEQVYAMGFPSTRGGHQKILTPCKMVGNDRYADSPGYQEFLGDVHPGNSGGPLFNLQGEALGVVTLGYEDGSARAYAIPILTLKADDFVPLSRRESNPANANRLLLLGEKVLKLSREHRGILSDLAEDLFQQALLEDFSNAEINYKIGAACRDQADYRRSAAYFVRSLRLKPWPDSGARCYQELGIALEKSGKKDSAATVWKEGAAKYPTEGGPVWDALSIHYFNAGNYLEAAIASRQAVRAFGDRGSVMNEAYKQSRLRLSADDLVKLQIREDAILEEFQRMKEAADKARAAGTPFLTKECELLVRDYEGATRELAPAGESRTPTSKRARKIDPWESLEVGTWFRFRITSGEAERFEDVGLKSREADGTVLTVQSC
ncbi:MAG TPA: serine protease, partial [Planctomycetota bacterium]|nr:serine protease [Planctomycetota bacterium]